LEAHNHRHKIDDRIEKPVNDNRNIAEKFQSVPMSNKEIEAWKLQVAKDKSIFVASNVKSIHPVVDRIVTNLCKIDLINYVRVTKEDIYASNEIKIIGRTKMPVSTPGHPSVVGVHLILDFRLYGIQFFEINSAVKGYGEKMVKAVVTAIPDDWEAAVVMDYSGGFWNKMSEKYDRIVML
jgi:hypothetical protein